MKLVADVSVSSRLQVGSLSRMIRSSLVIGCLAGSKDAQILLQTSQNKTGTCYKIHDNIERLFTTFLAEGKATVRLRIPAHDLIIKCEDKLQLKCFIQTLKHVSLNKDSSARMSNLNSGKTVIPKPKTSLTITEKSEYPVLKNFPRTLEKLSINTLDMKNIDTRIFQLFNLQVLNLSDNSLINLPASLGDLRSLTTLNLSKNSIGTAADQHTNSMWMNSAHFVRQLRMLDLSFNDLKELSTDLSNLRALVHLKLNDNMIGKLPGDVGRLVNLRYLSVAKNHLITLPHSVHKLKLQSIDVAGNELGPKNGGVTVISHCHNSSATTIEIPNLIELAATVIINKHLRYPEYAVPKRVVNYLRTAKYCACGSACFETSVVECVEPMFLDKISECVTSDHTFIPAVKCNYFVCSQKCFKVRSQPRAGRARTRHICGPML